MALPGLDFLFPLAGMAWRSSCASPVCGSYKFPYSWCCRRCSSSPEVWELRVLIGLGGVWELQIPLLVGVVDVGALAEFVYQCLDATVVHIYFG